MKISVLGSGGWGTALAMQCRDCGAETVLWGKFEDEIDRLCKTRQTPLLGGVMIPEEILVTTDKNAVGKSDIIIIATPSFAVEENALWLKETSLAAGAVIVSVAKGFEKKSLKRFSQVIGGILTDNKIVVLSGPSHAEEVARRKPTSIVAASEDSEAAKLVQKALMNENFRIYTNTDVIGVEVGAALKNVIAMAAGVCDGMSLGDNAKAALITRGISEIRELGVSMGAKKETFAGLSGLGDLIVTCTSQHSRNRRFGQLIGEGMNAKDALKAVGMTVESYYATAAAVQLADKYGVEMPITRECYEIIYNNQPISKAPQKLMSRTGKEEN